MLLYLHLAQSCSVMKKQCRMLLLLSQSIRSTCGALACLLIITSCHCLCVVIENHGPVLTSLQVDQSYQSYKLKHFLLPSLDLVKRFHFESLMKKKLYLWNSNPLCYLTLHCQHSLLDSFYGPPTCMIFGRSSILVVEEHLLHINQEWKAQPRSTPWHNMSHWLQI